MNACYCAEKSSKSSHDMKLLGPYSAAMFPDDYSQVIHNCNLSPCEKPYTAPLPELAYMQFFIDFGTVQPLAIQITAIDTCSGAIEEQLFTQDYVAGQDAEGRWYGVFRYFFETLFPFTCFVIHVRVLFMDASEAVWFSEEFCVEDCLPLTKLKACMPEGATATGYDVNDVYYGLPQGATTLGIPLVRYFHIVFLREAKVRELSNKITFVNNLLSNKTFRSQVDKVFQLESEMVPQWYKDLILAVLARGTVEINGRQYNVTELAFEGVADDDLLWKPFAQLTSISRQFFGCDTSECIECCTPQVLDAFTVSEVGSESEVAIQGTYRYGEDENICDEGIINFLYSSEPFGTGTQMFTDSALTTPLTGFNYIRDINSDTIYEIDPVTGIVGVPSGASCEEEAAVVSFRVGQDFNAGQPTNPDESVTVYVSTNGGANWTAIGSVLPDQTFPYALVPTTWNTSVGQGFLFGVLKTMNGQNVNNGLAGSSAFAQCGLVSNPQNLTVTSTTQTVSIWIDWDAAGTITTC